MEPKQPIVLPVVQPGLPPYPAIRAVLQVRRKVTAVLHKQGGEGAMASLGTVRQGDVGTVFEVTIIDEDGAVDISNAAVRQVVFGRPVVGWFTRQAEFKTDGKDGKIQYKSQPGDLDRPGEWRLQGKVALPTFVDEFHTEMATFYVEPVIEEMNHA
jgi:hypothetical protein